MTITAERPLLRSLTDQELAGMSGGDLDAEIMAEFARRDESARQRKARRADPVAAEWREMAHAQYLAAEAQCRGNLVARDSRIADGWELWSGPERFAMANATEELRNFWLENPRITVTQYAEQVRHQRGARDDELERDEPGAVRPGISEGEAGPGVRGDRAGDAVPVAAARAGTGVRASDGPDGDRGHAQVAGGVMTTVTEAPASAGPRLTWERVPPEPPAQAQGRAGATEPGWPEQPTTVSEPEPAAVPSQEIDGAMVLDEAERFARRFWIPPTQAAMDALILWCAHVWVQDTDGEMAWYSTPRIAFVSDEPGSGKSRCLEILDLLCPRAEILADPTAPAMLSLIAERHSTLLVDEVDLLFGNGNAAKAVRAVINSGYRRGAAVARVKGPQSTYAPVAMAGLATSFMGNPTLAPTRSRCVIVHCAPPPPGIRVERYREQLHGPLGKLAGQAMGEWAAAHAMELATTFPEMDEDLSGRQADIWEPLLAVADIAGGTWPARARAALRELCKGDRDEAPVLPPRLRLLRDIRSVWPEGADRMTSADLVGALLQVPGAPWGAMWSPLTAAREIPALLGEAPAKIKADGRALQGWYLAQMEPMWADLPAG